MDQTKNNNDASAPAEDKKENSGLSLETATPIETKPSETDAPSKGLGLEADTPTEGGNEIPSSGLSLDTPVPAPESPSNPISLEDDAPMAAPKIPETSETSLRRSPSESVPTPPILETPQENIQAEAPLEPAKEIPMEPTENPIEGVTPPTTTPITNEAENLSHPHGAIEDGQEENSAEDITDDQDDLENSPPPSKLRRSGNTMLLPIAALGVVALVAGGYFWMTSEPTTPTPMVAADQAMADLVTEDGIDSLPIAENDALMEHAEIDGDISDGLEIQETTEIIKPKTPSDDLLMSDSDFIELEGNSEGSDVEESLSFTPNEISPIEGVDISTNEPDFGALISAEEALIANQDILATLQPPPEADTQSTMLNGTNARQGMTELPAKAAAPKKIGTDAIIRPLPRGFLFVKKNHSAKTPDSRQVTAQVALSEHRYEAAYQLFDTISAKKPKNEKALMGRAVSLHKLGRHNEAINAYQKVLTRNSKNLEALSNMLGILRLENPQAIIGKLEDLYSSYPTNDTIIAQLGITYGDLKKYDQALAKLKLATSLAPKNPSHALNKAVILDHMKQPSKAAEAYQHALALDRQFSDGQPSLPTDMIKKRLTLLR